MMDDNRWIGKKIFLETISGRRYTGIVIDETTDKIIIKDKYDKVVEIPKSGAIIQEEER